MGLVLVADLDDCLEKHLAVGPGEVVHLSDRLSADENLRNPERIPPGWEWGLALVWEVARELLRITGSGGWLFGGTCYGGGFPDKSPAEPNLRSPVKKSWGSGWGGACPRGIGGGLWCCCICYWCGSGVNWWCWACCWLGFSGGLEAWTSSPEPNFMIPKNIPLSGYEGCWEETASEERNRHFSLLPKDGSSIGLSKLISGSDSNTGYIATGRALRENRVNWCN